MTGFSRTPSAGAGRWTSCPINWPTGAGSACSTSWTTSHASTCLRSSTSRYQGIESLASSIAFSGSCRKLLSVTTFYVRMSSDRRRERRGGRVLGDRRLVCTTSPGDLPRKLDELSTIANTGSAGAVLTVLNTRCRSRRKTQTLSTRSHCLYGPTERVHPPGYRLP